jgi:hypothetical protein
MGFIAHEYGYKLEDIGNLTAFQIEFLIEWTRWFSKQKG